jgi:glycosyltransferase involved in cell wall biosynthesis
MMKLISVIVPVYNCGRYLEECIKSIISQTYKEIEIILVNDGSTDNTAAICECYKKLDSRIKVIHKENEGPTSARKAGLKVARGEFITFVDGDDWIECNLIEEMVAMQEQTDTDLVITGCIKETDKGPQIVKNNIGHGYYGKEELIDEVYPRMLYYDGFYRFGITQYMCSKLYRLEDVIRVINSLDERVYNGEDVIFVYTYLLHVKNIYISEKCLYHYRIHQESITGIRPGKDYFEKTSILFLNMKENFEKSEHYHMLIDQLNMYFCYMTWLGVQKLSMKAFQSNGSRYLFPFEAIDKNTKIALYGAGNVGKSYYRQLKQINYPVDIVWVDRNYENLSTAGMKIIDPIKLCDERPDKVIVAIENERIATEVINNLKQQGIEEDKIIWKIYKI